MTRQRLSRTNLVILAIVAALIAIGLTALGHYFGLNTPVSVS